MYRNTFKCGVFFIMHLKIIFAQLVSPIFWAHKHNFYKHISLYFSKYRVQGFWFGTCKFENVCSKISSKQIMGFLLCCKSTKPQKFSTPGLEPPTLILSLLPLTSHFAATFTGLPGTGRYTNGPSVTQIALLPQVFPLKDTSTGWIPTTGFSPHVVTAEYSEYFCRCLCPATENEHTATFVSQHQNKSFTTNSGGMPYDFFKN